MKGTISNLQSTEKLWIFSINGNEYAAPKSKLKETLMDGFEIEFTESIRKGNQKDDGDFWPDSLWANKITIIGDGGPGPSTAETTIKANPPVKQFKHTVHEDPDKQRSIEKQSAIKCAVKFYAQRGQATCTDVLGAAQKFYDFMISK